MFMYSSLGRISECSPKQIVYLSEHNIILPSTCFLFEVICVSYFLAPLLVLNQGITNPSTFPGSYSR